MNMKKYLVTSYVVENDVWNQYSSRIINSSNLKEEIDKIESFGYRLVMSNIFVKTFTCDDGKSYLACSFVELPNL